LFRFEAFGFEVCGRGAKRTCSELLKTIYRNSNS
jgi:hypothetical protein